MPAAIAIPAIVGAASAGGAVASAKIGSNAAKDAARTQSAAADKALAFQKEQYQQARQDFAPYQQQGAGAVQRLGQLSTQPRQTFDPTQPQGMPRQGMPAQPMPMANLGNPMGQTPPQMAQAQEPQGSAFMGNLRQMMTGAQGGPQAPPAAQGGPMVTVQAPDGSTRQVPSQLAQQLVQRGARVIQ